MGKKSRRTKPAKQRMPFVARTFEGLPAEGDWIAMREFVPAATAHVTLTDGRRVRICSLLPGGGAGLVRPDGEIWVGLQVLHNHGDISRDLAHVIETGIDAEPGTPLTMSDPGVGARLQDLVDPASEFVVEVHDGFDFWIDDPDAQARAALDEANDTVAPTRRLESVDSAYVTTMGEHTFLRWVMLEPEDAVLTAFSRLHAAGTSALTDDTKLIGMFRAHGVLVPVWELFAEVDLETATRDFAPLFAEAMADDSPLTSEQRAAKQQLQSRQVTVR